MGRLFADRFLILENNMAIDLAFGRAVTLCVSEQSVRSEQQRWVERCSSLMTLRHPHHVQLVDYGLVGTSRRFEAYRRAANSGITSEPRHTVGQVIDWLETTQTPSGILYLTGSCHGRTTAVLESVAREARLRGFIPLDVVTLVSGGGELEREVRELIAGRHVLLLHDRTHRGKAIADDLPGLLMTLDPSANRNTLALIAVPPGEQKTPCVFLDRVPPASVAASRLPQVSETRPAYQVGQFRARSTNSADPRAIALLRDGESLLRRGRHAPAERQLRAALGACNRREDWLNAGRSGLLLGELLLVRGRAVEASEMFHCAREHLLRAQATGLAAEAMVYLGLAQTDQMMFAESEATLRAALAASSLSSERRAAGASVLALGR